MIGPHSSIIMIIVTTTYNLIHLLDLQNIGLVDLVQFPEAPASDEILHLFIITAKLLDYHVILLLIQTNIFIFIYFMTQPY